MNALQMLKELWGSLCQKTVVWNRATKKMYANFASPPPFLRGLESSKGSQVELGD